MESMFADIIQEDSNLSYEICDRVWFDQPKDSGSGVCAKAAFYFCSTAPEAGVL